jgi:hypothetical protein
VRWGANGAIHRFVGGWGGGQRSARGVLLELANERSAVAVHLRGTEYTSCAGDRSKHHAAAWSSVDAG